MNFYPYLEKSYQSSKNILNFFIANAAMIFLGISFFLGWYFLYNDFFMVLRETLQHTSITEDIARHLITQAYSIGHSMLLILPLVLIIWRVSVPFTLKRLNQPATSSPWWHIFLFDSGKILLFLIMGLLIRYEVNQAQWVLVSVIGLLLILAFSLFRYSQIIYFSSPHLHPFSVVLRSWFSQLSQVFFLHSLDLLTFLIGFCLLGLVLASFIYMPFVVSAIITAAIMYLFGRLSLIWKGIWSYAACAILTAHSSS